MLQKHIDILLGGTQFQSFLSKVRIIHQEFVKDSSINIMDKFEYIQKDCIEMGRLYNHFIFTATQLVIDEIKKQKNHQSDNSIQEAITVFLKMLEEKAHTTYTEEMSFFMIYRDKTKEHYSK